MAAASFPSLPIQLTPAWRGLPALKHLIILHAGASYCDIGYDDTAPPPTRAAPLGVPWPGTTYAEPGAPNWVGHLVASAGAGAGLLVWDYARGGARVHDVRWQVERAFLARGAGMRPRPAWAPWKADDTLFATWVGINDAAYPRGRAAPDHAETVRALFDVQATLYAAGARAFLLINVPPLHRSPARVSAASYANWNTLLASGAHAFATAHADATVLLFSSWALFTRVLDAPATCGFTAGDLAKEGGAIWVDHIHPTSAMHAVIAEDLAAFLRAQPAGDAPPDRDAQGAGNA